MKKYLLPFLILLFPLPTLAALPFASPTPSKAERKAAYKQFRADMDKKTDALLEDLAKNQALVAEDKGADLALWKRIEKNFNTEYKHLRPDIRQDIRRFYQSLSAEPTETKDLSNNGKGKKAALDTFVRSSGGEYVAGWKKDKERKAKKGK
jgi:hypothetical protein